MSNTKPDDTIYYHEAIKKYDYLKDRLISIYAGDELKPTTVHPNDYDGNWCITNGHIAIIIPHELITAYGESKLGYQGLWANPLPEPKLFTLEAFKLALKDIPSQPDYFYSIVDCYCKSGCQKCDFEGYRTVLGKRNGLIKYEVEGLNLIYIKLVEAFFDANVIYRVIYAIELLGLELSIIELTHNSKSKQSIIKVGDVQIIFMPLTNQYDEPPYAEIL